MSSFPPPRVGAAGSVEHVPPTPPSPVPEGYVASVDPSRPTVRASAGNAGLVPIALSLACVFGAIFTEIPWIAIGFPVLFVTGLVVRRRRTGVTMFDRTSVTTESPTQRRARAAIVWSALLIWVAYRFVINR